MTGRKDKTMTEIRITFVTKEDFVENTDNLDKATKRTMIYSHYSDLTEAIDEFRKTFDGYRITKAEYIDYKADKKVSRSEFIRAYNLALDEMFGNDNYEDNEIYGHDVTIHWNGIYCNVGDGATAYNHIISNIESVIEEDGED